MFQGETIMTGADNKCDNCGQEYKMQVLKTNTYYIGTKCCGMPYTRESHYYETAVEAQKDLDNGNVKWRT